MFVRILQNAFPEYDQVLVWILDCRVLLLHHLNHVVPKLSYVLFVRLHYILRIYIETPQVPKLSLFLSIHRFFHALLILTVEGEYGMKLALVTASDRNAYTVASILVGDDYHLFFAVLWIRIRTVCLWCHLDLSSFVRVPIRILPSTSKKKWEPLFLLFCDLLSLQTGVNFFTN